MQGILIRWVFSAAALLLISYLFDGIKVDSIGWAFIAAMFMGILNALVRPFLLLLTLPITVVTMGFFILVINGLMLWLTGKLLAGFSVEGFWTAIFGALGLSAASFAANSIIGNRGQVDVITMHRRGNRGNTYWS